ncbi:AAA-like domain-containing protein [Rivularia sp. UHCC 0363]|uniref:AAA-like domain-containing protein n=1 Tax=Rivularia sp. UHCC 0363 TaxID=3110244 RepID=UPI002B1ECDC8|nr:AAA-like domain-containing protein [Rivularia sp. UHCC 0363]MEA5598191.1 AAA-like domain-containing protein [Rivularia sp. UHCC 0363]
MTNFNLDEAIKVANKAVNSKFNRNLTDIEIIIIKGAWQRQEYDEIAAQNQYATTYLSQDVAPKLWKILGDSLEEKVKKSNFKEALKRQWEKSIYDADTNPSYVKVNNNLDTKIKTDLLSQSPYSENFKPEIYVRRPELEIICYETLLQPGSLIRIKAPSLMGKTSLIIQVINQLAKKDYRNVILSFELADRNTHFSQLNKFLRWFCSNISRELSLPSNLDEYWDEEGMGAKVSCTTYFEQYLLVAVDSSLVLCLDNVDLLFPYPEIYEDFFGLLRSWYEKARSRQVWKKLRLVLIHSTDVYIRLNINQSPFNVGLPLELSEFTYEQVQDFAQQHQLNLDVTAIDSLIKLVGGHPYLLEMAFSHIKNHSNIRIEQILIEATTETGIYAHHLREHWLNLQQHHELAIAVHQIVDSNSPILLEPIVAYQLQSMGLVKLSGNLAEIRCHLYRQYFRMRLKEF